MRYGPVIDATLMMDKDTASPRAAAWKIVQKDKKLCNSGAQNTSILDEDARNVLLDKLDRLMVEKGNVVILYALNYLNKVRIEFLTTPFSW